jgi:hypothetical protein
VCPVCGKPIILGDPAGRMDDCIVHAHCMTDGRAMHAPCDPKP